MCILCGLLRHTIHYRRVTPTGRLAPSTQFSSSPSRPETHLGRNVSSATGGQALPAASPTPGLGVQRAGRHRGRCAASGATPSVAGPPAKSPRHDPERPGAVRSTARFVNCVQRVGAASRYPLIVSAPRSAAQLYAPVGDTHLDAGSTPGSAMDEQRATLPSTRPIRRRTAPSATPGRGRPPPWRCGGATRRPPP